MDIYEEMLLQIVDVLKKHNKPIPDITHKEAIEEIRTIVSGSATCGNCKYLILRNHKYDSGYCQLTRLRRKYYDTCVHEDEEG